MKVVNKVGFSCPDFADEVSSLSGLNVNVSFLPFLVGVPLHISDAGLNDRHPVVVISNVFHAF